MTINKAKGQTLKCVGIYLPSPVFPPWLAVFTQFDNISVAIIEGHQLCIKNDEDQTLYTNKCFKV